MQYFTKSIVLQEVPNEISLAFTVAGCPNNCKNCSWKNTIEKYPLFELTNDLFENLIQKYVGYVSCILFMGGEWCEDLIDKLRISKKNNFKTCLYTGLELKYVKDEILSNLDYIKTGRYIEELGGLDNPNTNQKFIDLNTGQILNEHFSNRDI